MECCSVKSSPLSSSFLFPSHSSGKWMTRRTRSNGRITMAIPMPPCNPKDPFLSKLAFAASNPEYQTHRSDDTPPLLDLVANPSPKLMAGPAQVERAVSYNEHRPRRPPPDLPSLLLNSRIVYIGMPLVPAVTELVIGELLYLQWLDPRQPTYVYINSTGTSRADGETVGMETEGFAIYDTMRQMKNEIQTVAVGAAIGQACLLLAAGKKGRRYMMPHATAMIQQPRLPSTGQMAAIDVHIRAKEVINNRDTLVKLLARHTGNSFETVAKAMQRPFYMDPRKALEFGVADKILWRGQEAMGEAPSPEDWDKRAGIKVVERPATYGAGNSGLG
eukprot:Gb_12676 [translate_table: standard]